MDSNPADRQTFEALVLRYQHAVCAMAYAVLRDRARSEEVAQEAFLVAWQKLPTAQVTPAWICGVARNLARNAARRRTEVTMANEPAAPADDPRDALIARESTALAAAALAELPERYREAVVLYYRGDESMAEVAAALGISSDTAKQRVHRGRARLRDALAPVEAALRATRPGPAFIAAAVAVWMTRGPSAHAAAIAAKSSTGSWPIALVAGGVIAIATVTAVIATGDAGGDHAGRGATGRPGATAPTTRATAPLRVTARFPAAPGARPRPPVANLTLDTAPGGNVAPTGTAKTVNLDFVHAPAPAMLGLLAQVMDAPIMVDPTIDGEVNITVHEVPAIDALDEELAQLGAQRVEVPAIRIVTSGGRTDASAFGGPPVSLHLNAAPVDDVLGLIEAQLQVPIGRLAIAGDPDAPEPLRVTIDVDEVPAGVALERVLLQTGLGYELTTGFIVSPAPE